MPDEERTLLIGKCTMTKQQTLPSVYAYNDFRKFLADYQNARHVHEPSFSKSEFSRSLLLPNTRSYFNDVMRGKKVSETFVTRIISTIGFTRHEAQYFRTLVRFNQADNDEERELSFEQLIALNRTPKRILDKNILVYYSKWYYGAIRAVLEVHHFTGDYADLAKRINPPITPREARNAVTLLRDLGLIKKNAAGSYKPSEKSIAAPENVRDDLVRLYQLTCMGLAQKVYAEHPRSVSYSSTNTISVSELGHKRLLSLTKRFQDRVRSLVHKDENAATKVYQMGIILFPLSK
jgi:uncharacterized protein (TIGR02147 family)